MKFEDVMQMMGNTPHVLVRSPEAEPANIYVKLEGTIPPAA